MITYLTIMSIQILFFIKFIYSEMAHKSLQNLHLRFDTYYIVKSTVKILSILVSFLENMNFIQFIHAEFTEFISR